MSQSSRGTRRPSWVPLHRQLLIVQRLLRGPASRQDLIHAVHSSDSNYYAQAPEAALRHDLKALREDWECTISYQARTYILEDLGKLAILDLPDDALQSLAFLDHTYSANNQQTNHQQVRVLLDILSMIIPATCRARLNSQHVHLRVMGPEVHYQIRTSLIQQIKRASRRHYIDFDYLPGLRDGCESHRKVAPLDLLQRDNHIYLLAYCASTPRPMVECYGGYVEFRVDYIIAESVRILPQVLPPTLPPRPFWRVVYHLAPEVARNRAVATWLPNTHFSYQPDGSAIVTAITYNLWQARRVLLSYAERCTVMEPPELVEMMRQVTKQLQTLYQV